MTPKSVRIKDILLLLEPLDLTTSGQLVPEKWINKKATTSATKLMPI